MAATDSQTESLASETANSAASDPKTLWYNESIENKLGPETRRLLEQYSHIPPSEVEAHVHAIRDKAWKIHPYPCIGQFRFLDLSISASAYYPTLLSHLKSTPSFHLLDLGCCFGQDLRALLFAGAPSSQLHGSDLRASFFMLGYELFRDRSSLPPSTFTEADIFDTSESRGLKSLEGKMSVVHVASFLHLFDWETQVTACERIVKLLKDETGTTVFGRQVGNEKAHEIQNVVALGKGTVWRHDGESFERMWEEVGRRTGTRWSVEVEMAMGEGWVNKGRAMGPVGWNGTDDGTRWWLRFVVTRVE